MIQREPIPAAPRCRRPVRRPQTRADRQAGRVYLHGRGILPATLDHAERTGFLRYTGGGVRFVGRDGRGAVEDRRHGRPRIEPRRRVPARVRFLVVESLLEDLGPLDLGGIQWVIGGGESGPDARPLRPEWALAVRDRRQAAGVAFLFKAWGAWGPDGVRRDQKANGRLRAGRPWDERPEIAGAAVAGRRGGDGVACASAVVIITTMNSADLIKELEKAGWMLRGVKGSHHVYTHPARGGHLSVPHPKKDLGAGLVRKLRKQAGLL